MRILAWVGFICNILSLLFCISGTIKEKTTASRTCSFIATILYTTLTVFFYMYLF
ncbi:hypothetical protein HYI06_05355 [Clostridium botulinum]|uniref:hypothetical protein n=1 Tax=Clostridium botulinum TaxID=1491 RepID=UPI000A6D99C1|nr:hypothetical protein [Clostridium botulinum]MBY7003545.1 hypothetical protein [Clostridium botulinum]MCR1145981.1 hypothetical protein [Clostridium botulinum]HCL4466756.1 hypothetical protein [Clostridium botulinum]HDK7215213.1 hypothetical protein [Clostridium botulinum]